MCNIEERGESREDIKEGIGFFIREASVEEDAAFENSVHIL